MEIEELKARCERAAALDMRTAYDPTTVPVTLTSFFWCEAFVCGGVDSTSVNADVRTIITATIGDVPEPFGRTDVAFVAASADGENGGPNWVCVGRLIRGDWFTVSAGCGYTGWGCQQGGTAYVYPELDAIVRLGLSDEERGRLTAVADDELFARADIGEND